MKKTISVLLALIMLLSLSSLFAGCKKDEDGEGEGTTEATTAPPEVDFEYLVSDISKLHIIYQSDASNDVRDLAGEIRDQIADKFGVTPKFRNDYVNSKVEEFAEAELEILVGRCANREESESFGATVRVNDYGYNLVGKKIVICGGDDAKMAQAVQHFIDNVILKSNADDASSVFFAKAMNYVSLAEYEVDSIKLGGKEIYEYKIVYPAAAPRQDLKHATRLANAIEEISGYRLIVKSDEETERSAEEIRVGATSRNPAIISELGLGADEYSICKADDGAVLVAGQSISGLIGAVDALVADMSRSEKEIVVDMNESIKGVRASETLKSMTFNVLYKEAEERAPYVIKRIKDEMPDTIGFQEVTTWWMNKLESELGEIYASVGEPRSSGGEYSCIFYRKDKFDLLDSDTKWLSLTPDISESKFSESSLPRIATFAKLQRKSDNRIFVHINTHLDHVGAMSDQAEVLLNIADALGEFPTIITGDFNVISDHDAYKTIVNAGYADSKKEAVVTDNANTFINGQLIIDYLFISENIYAIKYKVLTGSVTIGSDSMVPSDHNAVILEYVI